MCAGVKIELDYFAQPGYLRQKSAKALLIASAGQGPHKKGAANLGGWMPSVLNAADTAWMIVATALVLMMTLPGLALFYAGMVRRKNVLATMAQSVGAIALVSLLWMAIGYSLVFTGTGDFIGGFDRVFLIGMQVNGAHPAAPTIPEALFMLYQMTFAVITCALIGGAVLVERVFALPGLGDLLAESVLQKDFPVVQGATVLMMGIVILINLLVDISCALLDPRTRAA